MLVSLVVSTIAFFVAGYYIKRYLEKMDIPKGMVRTLSVFVLALAVSYAVGVAADFLIH
jgi:VIT1/CCC1 family predicted Fe2+/Mn2+ transporter